MVGVGSTIDPALTRNLIESRGKFVLAPAVSQPQRGDQIPLGPSGAGMAYVLDEDTASLRLVRAFWISHELIRDWERWLVWARNADPEERAAVADGLLKRNPSSNSFTAELEDAAGRLRSEYT